MSTLIHKLQASPGESITREMVKEITRSTVPHTGDEAGILFSLLDKQDLLPVIKADLILHLRTYINESTEMQILHFTNAEHETIVQKAARNVLMQAGAASILPALERMATGNDVLQFLHIVISHRLGIVSKYFKLPGGDQKQLPANRSEGFKSRIIDQATFRKAMNDLASGNFNLGSYDASGLQIECSNNNTIVLFHKEVVATGFNHMLQRPSVLGAIVKWCDEPGEWCYSRIILAGPVGKDQFYMAVYRRTGQLESFGTGMLQDRTLELHSFRQHGNPIMITRMYWHGGAAILSGIIDLTKNPGRTPIPWPHERIRKLNPDR